MKRGRDKTCNDDNKGNEGNDRIMISEHEVDM